MPPRPAGLMPSFLVEVSEGFAPFLEGSIPSTCVCADAEAEKLATGSGFGPSFGLDGSDENMLEGTGTLDADAGGAAGLAGATVTGFEVVAKFWTTSAA